MKSATALTVVQINDSHSYLDIHQEVFWDGGQAVYRPAGGYARIGAMVRQIRAENPERVLFCDCGDTLHGTYPAVQTQGRALIPVLNSLELDAMTAHWEFAYGPAVFQERAGELGYPMLAVNVYEKATNKRVFPPYRVKEVGGLRIGMIGIACNIVDKTMPASYSEGLYFTLGREELPEIVEELRTVEKVDLIVLISHLGFPQDMNLLSEVQGVDVCLSGHTHNRLERPAIQGQTIIIQSGCHGSFLGRLDLKIQGGRIVDFQHELMEAGAGVTPDAGIGDLVRQALAPYREELSAVVGRTATALNRANMFETTMDNFLLQAMLESTGAELAFSNGWRFGAPVAAGDVTVNDLYNMVPMNPPISTVELRGEEIMAMLEENLERTFSRDPFRQLGGSVKRGLGFTAYVKIENPPGERIQQVFAGKERLLPHRSYPTAFVTEQGVPLSYGRNRQTSPVKAVAAMSAYLAKRGAVEAELRGTFVAA